MPGRPETAAQGWVYLLRHSSGVYKVGITLDPRSRFKQLKVGSSNTLISASFVNNPGAIEKQLQRLYASKRLPQSEYFSLDSKDVDKIISLLKNGGIAMPLKTIKSTLAIAAFFFILFSCGAIATKDDWRNQLAIELGEKKIVNKTARLNNRGREVVYGKKTLYNSMLPPALEISDVKIKRRDMSDYGINSHHWDAYYKITNKSEHEVRRVVVKASYRAKGDYFTDNRISSYPECMSPGQTIDGNKIWLRGMASLDLAASDKEKVSLYTSAADFCNE
ncbi:GIY-YIG nuclease family protein [Synechococcus sp. MU1643]|uniref:GIY-YIG nuclease family protein n=1 Tax=Synechococcus sp. MU1643 TaxID=2508349 RepID=UPI001CF8FE51|nr:GIY-YIG nuclease family protein [Synechococcus sp. MU1643]MCB4428491.1 GIY-YIG nuclease family protein [Synechococcus sp. MU1643]